MSERFFLYDDSVSSSIRFVSFLGERGRYDLCIIHTDRYFGKAIVLDIQRNRFAIIGPDDLNEEGYIEYAFQLSTEEAAELTSFLLEIV
ncbi:hypothetical protein SAMN05877753_111119 [Bacillus oleivorans]|uniref:DUF3055 family protein n=1 Tax=Bacillus oleivorans TaxID=1448271 RepID=A0A285D625_9BACI|nr:DUF3055 domain-containing protein [Bacillus oleivorans]SNX75267.1 hypothetical protein SAMN05877753_111119 [Bacillus oleivorans]